MKQYAIYEHHSLYRVKSKNAISGALKKGDIVKVFTHRDHAHRSYLDVFSVVPPSPLINTIYKYQLEPLGNIPYDPNQEPEDDCL